MVDIVIMDDERNPEIDWDNSARNVDGIPYVAAENDGKAKCDPDRRDDGTLKPGHPTAITSLNAKSLQVKSVQSRLANKTKKAREALLAEAKAACPPDYDIETWQDAWGLFTGGLVHDGLDENRSLRARVAVYKAIGKAVDAFPDKATLTVHQDGSTLSGSVDEVYMLLMEARRAKQDE